MSLGGSPRRIGLVVDHPLRDLHGIVLVAHLLAQQGHTAVLLPFYGQNFDLPLLDLDLLVVNYVRPANLRLIRYAQRRGVAIAVLDTEGGLLPDEGPTSPRGMASFLVTSGLDRDIALYMFWGPALRDAVVANSKLDPARAVVTGCPRFDLAHEPWSECAQTRDFVLINTNFPAINNAHAVDGAVDRGALRSVGFEDERIDRLVTSMRLVMERVLEAIAQIAAARPQRRFVLRPHPFERAKPYRIRFADTPNVEIRREGSVLDVLAQSSSLLHVNCTTAIEAALSGVPPISLDFANEEEVRHFAKLAGVVSHGAHSIEQALAMLDCGRDLGPASGLKAILPHFGPSDGSAAERATAAIVSAASRAVEARERGPRSAKSALQSLAGLTIGSGLIERFRQKRRPSRSEKALAVEEVESALARFANAQGVTPASVARLRTWLGMPTLSLEIRKA